MDKYKKKLTNALDGFRSHHSKIDIEVNEKICADHVVLSKIVRHGFPDNPCCLAYDPVQKLLAIGSGNGSIRLLGNAGVDYHLKHETLAAVTHIAFLINEGGLITATRDDMIHLWNYRQKIPDIVHSLQMAKEKITCIELPVASKWLYVGTERGNVYVVCVADFKMSPYSIRWNKSIDVSCRTHPGAVRSLSVCPIDPTKLLMGFENGYVVLWNLITKETNRFKNVVQMRTVSWHVDGKQFMCGCNDGSLVIWNIRKTTEPEKIIYPREKKCRGVTHLHWQQGSANDMVIFAGGMGLEEGASPAITVVKPKGSLTVLELDFPIIDICPLMPSPYSNIQQLAPSLAVLMKQELIILDMTVSGFPSYENPHPTDISESPVTFLRYFSDCPIDLIGALTIVGRKQKVPNSRISPNQWPLIGGADRECATSNQELLLTGHEDGSIKLWQSSGEHLTLLNKLKTGRHFERLETEVPFAHLPDYMRNPFAVQGIELCLESRLLLVAGSSGQVTLFRFSKVETCNDVAVINVYSPESCSDALTVPSSPNPNNGDSPSNGYNRNNPSRTSSVTSDGVPQAESHPLKVRGGAIKRSPGFQPELVALITAPHLTSNSNKKLIPAMTLNSAYGIIAIATINDLILIDIFNCTLIFSCTVAELYSLDPSVSKLCANNDDSSPQEYCDLPNNSISSEGHLSCSIATGRTDRPSISSTVSPTSGIVGMLKRRTSEIASSAKRRIERKMTVHVPKEEVVEAKIARPDSLVSPKFPIVNNNNNGRRRESMLSVPFVSFDFSQKTPSPTAETSPTIGETRSAIASSAFASRESRSKILQSQRNMASFDDKEMMSGPRRNHSFYRGADSIETPTTTKDPPTQPIPIPSPHPPLIKSQTSLGTASSIVRRLTDKVSFRKTKSTANEKAYMKSGRSSGFGTPNGSHLDLSDSNLYNCGETINANNGSSSNLTAQDSPSLSSSLEKLSLYETISFLNFISTPAPKSLTKLVPTLWVGTTSGTCLAFALNVPPDRLTNQVHFTNVICGQKLKGEFLLSAFMDDNFRILDGPTENHKEVGKESPKLNQNKVKTKVSLSPTLSASTDSGCGGMDEISQIAILVSESHAKVIGLPSSSTIFSYKPDRNFVKVQVTHISGYPALLILNEAGEIVVLSLPSLKLLFRSQLFPKSVELDDPMISKSCFSDHGLGVYMVTPSELQKFTVDKEMATQIAQCSGEIFVPVDMPEAPKASFLKGVTTLFSGSNVKDSSELESIFRENQKSGVAGTTMKSVARTITNPTLTNMEHAQSRGISAGQAAAMAIQNLNERGEKLNAVIDTTENLRNNAQGFASNANKLVEKYEKKKWYQL